MQLIETRGYVGLFGPDMDTIANASVIPVPRQITPFHVTLFTKEEVRATTRDALDSVLKKATEHDIIDVGLCQRGDVFFRAVWWPQGQVLRTALKLPLKHFHITLSASDDHTVDKSVEALIAPSSLSDEDLDVVARSLTSQHAHMVRHVATHYASRLSASAFDHVYQRLVQGEQVESAWQLVTDRLAVTRHFMPAQVRQADLYAREMQWKMAMLYYQMACEHMIAKDETDAKVYAYCLKNLAKCCQYKELGALFDEEDVSWLSTRTALQPSHVKEMAMPSTFLKLALQEAAANASLEERREQASRDRQHLARVQNASLTFYKMPRFWSWVVPFRLAVMSTPRKEEDIDALSELGIGLVVTLTEEEPLPAEWFNGKSVQHLFLPVPNYKAPTIAQVETFIDAVVHLPADQAALVHCGAGKGRAGTFTACYLLACGFSEERTEYPAFSAAQVMSLLRTLRPGSIETREQEDFIATYLQHLYRHAGQTIEQLPEPKTSLVLDGKLDKSVSLIVCCGLPGSGKSYFANLLKEGLGFAVVSQDDAGGKDACFAEMSAAVKAQKRIVVDRCNPTVAARGEFLTMAWRPENALCLYFHYDAALCVQRADSRTNHPTILQGRADRIISSFAKTFVAPSRKEGFACVAEVTSFQAATELLEQLGCRAWPSMKPIHIYKFPRTRHLLNFGSATRDDLILAKSDVTAFLDTSDGSRIVVEEKVDGANLGISIDPDTLKFKVQNRSHYVNNKSHEQFRKIDKWLQDHAEQLFHVLAGDDPNQRLVLYGEWLYAKHAIHYDQLPDTFLAFDLYDTLTDKFYSRQALASRIKEAGGQLHQVPQLTAPATITEAWLASAIQQPSHFYNGTVEGVYLRREKGHYLLDRAKIVRSDFVSGDDQWHKGGVTQNQLK